ncbi:MAG: tRNA lysidine(34) synthetase TilS [Armatimonadota bacterium]
MRQEGLWQAGEHLLVAVSGGPDSVALLDILHRWFAPEANLRLAVAHINHGLRDEAKDDASFVEALANHYGIPYYLRQVDVPARVADTGESVEEAARLLRYAALRDIVREIEADRIVTGHTADDQAETVLMRLLRGAGLTGLAGIPARRENIVRPLLTVWRNEILAYLNDHELAYRTDLTNYSTDFTRNRIRLELLPRLETEYAPRLRVRLQHLAELARQDDQALEECAERKYAQLRCPMPNGLMLPATPPLPRAVIWRLWRCAMREVRGTLEDIGYDHLEDIHRLTAGRQVHLPGVRVLREHDHLVFLPAPAPGEPDFVIPEEPLPIPGRLCLLPADCCLHIELPAQPVPLAGGDIAVMDAAALQGPLTVRSWRPGDRYRPFGAPGTRKLQDIFVDAGVPRRLRSRIPVILDANGIVWLAGFRIADRVKSLPTTTQYLRMIIEWELNPWTLKPSGDM